MNRHLDEIKLDEVRIRVIYYAQASNTFSLKFNKDGDATPLFMATDVISGSGIQANNQSRIHARYSSCGLSTKITFKDPRLQIGAPTNKLWFYNVRGLFKMVFEHHTVTMQQQILTHLRDLWLQRTDDPPLPDTLQVDSDTLVLSDLSTESPMVYPVTTSATGNTDLPTKDIHDSTPRTIGGGERYYGMVVGGATCQSINQSPTQVCLTDRELECANVEEVRSSDLHATYGQEDELTHMKQLYNHMRRYLKDESISRQLQNSYLLEKLNKLLELYNLELLSTDCSAFPFEVIDDYITLVRRNDTTSVKHFANDFNVPVNKNIFLGLISEWLGKEFRTFHSLISHKVEEFKKENIDSINNLPSPQALMSQLFPQSMLLLIANWMGPLGVGLGVPDQVQAHMGPPVDHTYSPPPAASPATPSSSCRQVAPPDETLYQIIQLILEFANNTLISGVAHVVYSRLVQ